MANARPVYSTTDGDLRKARDPRERERLQGDGRVRVRRERRRGKDATTIEGVPLRDTELKALAKRLKQRCGVGGTVKDGVIELQGDHRDVVVDVLRADGHDVVLAGG